MTLLAMSALAASLALASPQATTRQGTGKPGPTQAQQRGSDSLPVVVKLLPAKEAAEQAARESAHVQVEEKVGAKTLFWTRVLGVGTLVIGLFTLTLWWTTRGTLRHLKREFIAAHRPRLRIRRLVLGESTITYTIANIGGTPARQVRIDAGYQAERDDVDEIHIPDRVPRTVTEIATMEAGTSANLAYESPGMYAYAKLARRHHVAEFYFSGTATYLDDTEVRRETGFHRYVDPITGRLVPVPGSDEEYED